jgi:hypothetical protein
MNEEVAQIVHGAVEALVLGGSIGVESRPPLALPADDVPPQPSSEVSARAKARDVVSRRVDLGYAAFVHPGPGIVHGPVLALTLGGSRQGPRKVARVSVGYLPHVRSVGGLELSLTHVPIVLEAGVGFPFFSLRWEATVGAGLLWTRWTARAMTDKISASRRDSHVVPRFAARLRSLVPLASFLDGYAEIGADVDPSGTRYVLLEHGVPQVVWAPGWIQGRLALGLSVPW